LYAYLSVPFVAAFGLSAFSARLLAAIGGTILIATAYLAARVLIDRRAAWITALLVAFSPWGFTFSRVAFRGILAPLFLCLGVFAFVKMFRDKRFAFLAAAAFGLSLHTYSVAKAFVPLALIALGLIFLPEMKRFFTDRANRRTIIFAAILFIALAAPIYLFSFMGPANARFERISVGNTDNPAITFVTNIAAHLNPKFLYLTGDANGRHTAPRTGGVLLLAAAPLFLCGLIALAVRHDRKLLVAPVLFLIGIVPSALTTDGIPHALRSIESAPFAHIISAGGAVFIFDLAAKLATPKIAIALMVAVCVAIVANGAWFLNRYFTTYPDSSQPYFQYGMQEAVEMSKTTPHERVGISGTIHNGYIFPLFYGAADIKDYQNDRSLSQRYFWLAGRRLSQLPQGPTGERWLLIGHPAELPDEPGMFVRGAFDQAYVKIMEREF
jgi:4-amino-4-deoxy-L-arabinose transferase-like glycosyltransferase